jgi:UDP-glucose 4-epimerase
MDDTGPTDSTVLVTGGAGFVGGHLAGALADAGNDVRVLDSLESGDPDRVPPSATLIRADVRDAGAVSDAAAGVDHVFHEAAVVSVPATVEDPTGTNATNLDGTLNVLEAARREDARAVVASSAAVYGHPESVPVAESDRKEPASPYGIQKLAADQYARAYHDLYGVETAALRYFNVYGPGQSGEYAGVIDVFLGQALAGDPLTVEGDGTQTRDFVHVEDVVRANLLAATADAAGEAYNVGTGDSVAIRDLADLVVEVTGSDSGVVHVDPREGDVERSRADVARARDRLGFEPTVSLREGLGALVRSG